MYPRVWHRGGQKYKYNFQGTFSEIVCKKSTLKLKSTKKQNFWSHKPLTNINKSLFEVQSESTKRDLNVFLTLGLTMNKKITPIPGIFQ